MRALVAALSLFAVTTATADSKLADAQYPEGALWHRGKLYWTEMARNVVMASDLIKSETFWRTRDCGPTSIAPYGESEFIVLCHLAHRIVRVSAGGGTIASIDRDSDGKPFSHPNAASADADGGVYFSASGTFALEAKATGAVLYLDREGRLTRVAEGIRYANGVAVDVQGRRLLVSAHLARQVLAFPIVAPGELGAPSVFFDLVKVTSPPRPAYLLAGPDGLELAADRSLVVAEYGAGQIHRVAADGTWLGVQRGYPKFITDVALLPAGRAAITAPEVNDAPPYPGVVLIRDRFLERFVK